MKLVTCDICKGKGYEMWGNPSQDDGQYKVYCSKCNQTGKIPDRRKIKTVEIDWLEGEILTLIKECPAELKPAYGNILELLLKQST